MYWTLELASHLSDAPWPATKSFLNDIETFFVYNGFIKPNANRIFECLF